MNARETMAIGEKIENRNHIVGFREEISAAGSDENQFFTWFDAAENAKASFIKGAWDFSYHVATPSSRYVNSPQDKVALEIGVGGGRLIASASRYFDRVIGVDIHESLDLTQKKLEQMGCKNVELLKCDGVTIPVPSNSVDFVYSFIVFNHLEKVPIVDGYLNEIQRILKPGGTAVVYFGRLALLSHNRRSSVLYFLDRLVEVVLLPRGWKELPARVNCTNIIFSLGHFKSKLRKRGFRIFTTMSSRKKVPDNVEKFGMQHGVIFGKP